MASFLETNLCSFSQKLYHKPTLSSGGEMKCVQMASLLVSFNFEGTQTFVEFHVLLVTVWAVTVSHFIIIMMMVTSAS